MNELLEQIARFQKLKEITGCSKISSYQIIFTFDPLDDQRVDIEWGCYDVGDYNRHYQTSCLKQNLIEHMKQEISKMEEVVKHYECARTNKMNLYVWEDVLTDYTSGMMVAVASTIEEARKILLDECRYLPEHDLEKEPKIVDLTKPSAFVVWGGG